MNLVVPEPVPLRLFQNTERPDRDGELHAGKHSISAGHGKTRFGGAGIPVCPSAMTQQRLEHNPGRQECLPHRVVQQPPLPVPDCFVTDSTLVASVARFGGVYAQVVQPDLNSGTGTGTKERWRD
jgi:hypothetical protein